MNMITSPLATVAAESAIKTNNAITGKIAENSNKTNEACARYANKAKGLQKDTVTLSVGTAATLGATVGVANSKNAQKVLSESFKPIKEAFCNSNFGKKAIDTCQELASEAKPYLEKGKEFVKNLPKPAKAILGIGAAVTALASTIIEVQTRKKDEQIVKEYAKKEAMIQQQFK